MRTVFTIFSMIIFSFIATCQTGKGETKPNIIIIFTDDQGYADLGCYGSKGFTTPNIDRLAADGIKFTNFYVPATVCTPSRAGLLTGQYPKRNNLHEAVLFPYSENGLSPDAYTIAELLKDNGYGTSCIGKWHLGHKPRFMPNNQGFDQFYGVPYSNDMDSFYYKHNGFQSPPLPFYRNKDLIETAPDQDYLTKRYTEEAVSQIKNRSLENPFFIYLAHNMPHGPLHVSPRFRGASELGLYGDVIMELDWSVGEIINTLKEEGIYDNTILIYTSDNGPDIGSADPLRGKKGQTWEGGQRVPGIITWPNKIIKGRTNNQMVSTLDLFPTLAHITESKIPEDLMLDGLNISNLLFQLENEILPDRPFYYYARNGELESVRYGKWKLHKKKSIGWNFAKEGKFPVSLYDLEIDKEEKNNLADQYPRIVKKITTFFNDVKL
ncbi:sulfatase family protein [Arenibacter palladensis]|uniref:sulfatase family protein n=1 Tax=Arenibacter palladensis TaxID=237373 RepID=UPI0026E452FD|nr:sulfatase [Arenibacter palladensis]MDO6602826.1 sulfatase [Arenibacter palladensis]